MKIRIVIAVITLMLTACFAETSAWGGEKEPIRLKVLTYNVCGLPDFITFDRNLIMPAKKRLRLISRLIKEYDIIGLQEMFIPDRDIIERNLTGHFVARGTTSPKVNPTGSGIYVLSKWPIQKSVFERWRVQYGVDAFSHKGFTGATTVLPGGLELDVYSLHAQAGFGPGPRTDNYAQLLDAVKRFSGGTGRPVLIIGDFNCETGEVECNWLLENSKLKHATSHLGHVDHIFYDENDSGWKITAESVKEVFGELVNGRRISDHLGVEAVIVFERMETAN